LDGLILIYLFIMVMLGCLADSVDHVGLAWLLGLGLAWDAHFRLLAF
jgi:hypothetical protein